MRRRTKEEASWSVPDSTVDGVRNKTPICLERLSWDMCACIVWWMDTRMRTHWGLAPIKGSMGAQDPLIKEGVMIGRSIDWTSITTAPEMKYQVKPRQKTKFFPRCPGPCTPVRVHHTWGYKMFLQWYGTECYNRTTNGLLVTSWPGDQLECDDIVPFDQLVVNASDSAPHTSANEANPDQPIRFTFERIRAEVKAQRQNAWPWLSESAHQLPALKIYTTCRTQAAYNMLGPRAHVLTQNNIKLHKFAALAKSRLARESISPPGCSRASLAI